MQIIGNDEKEAEYSEFKRDSHGKNVGGRPGQGILALNFFLYEHGLRDLNVPLKYAVKSLRGRHVQLEENPAYPPYWEKLMRSLEVFNACGRQPSPDDVEAMRRILA